MLSFNGSVNNTQDANDRVVFAAVATTAIDVVSATSLSSNPVAVAGNTLEAKASCNLATNSLAADAATLNGTLSVAPGFVVTSVQNGSGSVTATNTLCLLGALEAAATSTSFTVSGNLPRRRRMSTLPTMPGSERNRRIEQYGAVEQHPDRS